MIQYIVYFLRISILGLVLLPVLFPFVKTQIFHTKEEKINVFLYNKIPLQNEKAKLIKKIQTKFGKKIQLNYIVYGRDDYSIIQDYEDLIQKINRSNEVSIIVSKANFFGEESSQFTNSIKNSKINKEKRLYFLNESVDENYLVISNLFLPETIFVNNETLSMITIIGKAKPSSKLKINVELYNGQSFLNSKEVEIQVPESGIIKQILEVPVLFYKVGTQSVVATINSYPSLAAYPMNTAFSSVQVSYEKTTFLHVAYSPDWNLRLLRWKLKFWPNLDLLSYYILRNMNSEHSIPNSELSLIEFPSHRIFGSELSNLHGIIAQNFPFGDYLGEQESQNLVQYVKNGGRLVIQAGKHSFLDANRNIQQLFPCKSAPEFEEKKTYHWMVKSENLSLPGQYVDSLNHIMSHATFIKCRPKENVVVLAQLKETQDPVLTAMPLEKGIVVSFLASDWLPSYTSNPLNNFADSLSSMQNANASDSLFQWMVEFLQRKQDSGIRAPEIAGPRIYSEDKFLRIKSHGGLNLKQNLFIQTTDKNGVTATPFVLKNLSAEMLELQKPLSKFLPSISNSLAPSQQELSLDPSGGAQLLKFKFYPVFSGAAKALENKANPFLFEGVQSFDAQESIRADSEEKFFTKSAPLLVVYPWLLALSLVLLAIEQFLSLGTLAKKIK
ncbi:MAG: hypothetical protein V4591_07040 [Bdellovibrionota bacterium]